MKDALGLYYHAHAGNPGIRVYVRENADGVVEFRLWDADYPEVWDRHPWLSYEDIRAAASHYRTERNPNADPLLLYDLAVAKVLLQEEKS